MARPSTALRRLQDYSTQALLLQTLIAASLGGALFAWAGFPAAWISGGMIGAGVLAMWRGQAAVPAPLRSVCFVALGFTLGTKVTPETFGTLALWPLSLLVLAVSVGATIFSIRFYLRRVYGWDRMTATLSAIPGTFSYILLMSIKLQADTSRVAVMQVTRMVVLAAVLPSIIIAVEPTAAVTNPGVGTATDGWLETILAVLACGSIGYLVERAGMTAGTLVGTMIGSVALHGAGLTTAVIPNIVLIPCFVGIGAFIGVRLGGLSLREILRTLVPGVVAMVIGIAIAAVFALLGAYWLELPVALLLLAYAPGGIDVMAVLALSLDLDPTFVAAHGVLRFVGLSLLLPLWVRRVERY
ncbi:MAG: AbrB family transcriptional regulator [Pseudomonadota bacterium]